MCIADKVPLYRFWDAEDDKAFIQDVTKSAQQFKVINREVL